MKKTKYLHIALIILGIIFITIPVFHNNLWFDESYSVGMANKSFIDIWQIGSNDVHPILYYWILHPFSDALLSIQRLPRQYRQTYSLHFLQSIYQLIYCL